MSPIAHTHTSMRAVSLTFHYIYIYIYYSVIQCGASIFIMFFLLKKKTKDIFFSSTQRAQIHLICTQSGCAGLTKTDVLRNNCHFLFNTSPFSSISRTIIHFLKRLTKR
uniref:Uncharacterized protein n=1 Tax=Trypanosoma congolense (strain IL3000) TaxID=1068625 RepID=G0UPH8_TRYCI|nr:hypothetical protein, unlikely [Trypanosoma congolense IL3000]